MPRRHARGDDEINIGPIELLFIVGTGALLLGAVLWFVIRPQRTS